MCSVSVSKSPRGSLVVVATQNGASRKAVVPHYRLDEKRVSLIRTSDVVGVIATVMGADPTHPTVRNVFNNQVVPEVVAQFS
jgi:hypothetical protein